MDIKAYVDEIKLTLTGGVLQLEMDDATIMQIVNSAFREIQRYIDTPVIETMQYQKCIDLSPRKINSVTRVYRAHGLIDNSTTGQPYYSVDPMQMQQWQLLCGDGNLYNYQSYLQNYEAWNTSLQIRNTSSTDLAFIYDKVENKLYINLSTGNTQSITVEYIPRYEDVDQVVSDFWIDVLMRLSIAKTKLLLGRIRSRYTQSNALWTQDGEQLLQEGNNELEALRTFLTENTQLVYGID